MSLRSKRPLSCVPWKQNLMVIAFASLLPYHLLRFFYECLGEGWKSGSVFFLSFFFPEYEVNLAFLLSKDFTLKKCHFSGEKIKRKEMRGGKGGFLFASESFCLLRWTREGEREKRERVRVLQPKWNREEMDLLRNHFLRWRRPFFLTKNESQIWRRVSNKRWFPRRSQC